MRVAIISTILGYPWGGPDKRWTLLADACLSRGDSVLLAVSPFTAEHDRVTRLRRLGAQIYRRERNSCYRGWRDRVYRRLPGVRERFLEGCLSRFDPDVVFILLGGTYDILNEHYLAEWLNRSKVPYVASTSLNQDGVHFGTQDEERLMRFFGAASANLFMSSGNLQLAERCLQRTIPRAVIVQNPLLFGVDCPAEFPKIGARPQFGFVGRIDIDHKGLDLLLEAIARIQRATPIDLHLTGRCEDHVRFKELVVRSGLQNSVFVHPHSETQGLIEAYARAECVVLTSRVEGCASTMLEAMMVGRPQVVTPVGGVADWLTDGVNAFVSCDVSVDGIEAALRRALSSRTKWPNMGRAARSAFEFRRDPDPVGTLLRILDGAALREAMPVQVS